MHRKSQRPPPPEFEPHSSRYKLPVSRQKLEAILEPWIGEHKQREFLVRCLFEDGPTHHRGATALLLLMLGAVREKLVNSSQQSNVLSNNNEDTIKVPLRLPPHHREQLEPEDQYYPLALPMRAVREIFTNAKDADVIADCVVDGPPHHALANVAMVVLIQDILDRLDHRNEG